MAGIASDVYDVFHPTPVSLKELSAIVVSLEVWRYKTNEYRNNGKLEDFNPSEERILLKTVLPDLPSQIYDVIDKNVIKFGFSMDHWLRSHHERVFYFHYNHPNNVLEYFEDFVCDYNGAIHYVRTAERMMLCDRFDASQKFKIACTYFFVDDIRRLWPLVLGSMDLSGIDFSKSPQLYYWICCLTNKLDQIQTDEINESVEEVMLSSFMPFNRPSVEYFWNRVPSENRMRKAIDICNHNTSSFVRFILPKLNDQQLAQLLNEICYALMHTLFKRGWYDKEFILSTWMQIQNSLNEYAVANQFMKILKHENNPVMIVTLEDYRDDDRPFSIKNWYRFCCELWNSAGEKLKQAAAKIITSKTELFKDLMIGKRRGLRIPTKDYEFLSTVLSYATYDERKTFWHYYWHDLADQTRCKDFEKIMKLCFEKENELTHFKVKVMARDETFRKICHRYLVDAHYDELNDYANLLWPEIPTSRNNFKQQILQSAISSEMSIFICQNMLNKTKKFDEFINDAYGDVDSSKNFKNQLILSIRIRHHLTWCAARVPIKKFVEFIDTFVSNEETLLQIKTHIRDDLKKDSNFWKKAVSESSRRSLLSWCLGSDEEAEKCKPSCS